MPLSNQDLCNIAKEFAVSKSDQADDKAAIPNISEQISKKEEQAVRGYIPYNNAHVERITPYEMEHLWLDGTTYSTITQSQIETFSPTSGKCSYFFPDTWTKSNAQLTANGNGNPKTTSPNSESGILNDTLENQGLIAQINLLRNGQINSRPSDNLVTSYSPGATSITVNNSTHTVGNLLYISGSGTSAVVRIASISISTTTVLGITEIIAPATTIGINGLVVENIAGFSNSERASLISSSYQRILTELSNRIISSAALWNTAMINQFSQLGLNIDSASQINAAKSAISTAQTGYNNWLSLSTTGSSGKFVDTSLNNLATYYNTRNSFFATRIAQITAALGTVSQDSQGNYSGNGLYLQRFKCLNFLINLSNGALYQVNGLKTAKSTFEQKVANGADKLATYSNITRYSSFTADPVGSSVKADNLSQFIVNDSVLLTANDLPGIQCQIISISGTTVTLSIQIPKEYTKSAKAGIIKSV